MTRIGLGIAAICLLTTLASAQDGLRSASLPDRTPMNPMPPERRDLFLAGPDTYTPHAPSRDHHHRQLGDGYALGPAMFGLPYLSSWPYVREEDRRPPPPPPPAVTPEPAAPAPKPGTPKTFYVIPGCYAGDKPPQAERLRPGCSVSNTRIIPPILSANH